MKALIIDDNDELVITTSLIFQIQWPDSRTIATPLGRRGIGLARAEAPDLVLLDIGLLDIDGLEVLRQIRSFSSVPVIVVSGSPDPGARAKSLDWGATGYLEKPFDVPQLLSLIRDCMSIADSQRRAPLVASPETLSRGLPVLLGSAGR